MRQEGRAASLVDPGARYFFPRPLPYSAIECRQSDAAKLFGQPEAAFMKALGPGRHPAPSRLSDVRPPLVPGEPEPAWPPARLTFVHRLGLCCIPAVRPRTDMRHDGRRRFLGQGIPFWCLASLWRSSVTTNSMRCARGDAMFPLGLSWSKEIVRGQFPVWVGDYMGNWSV